LEDIERDALITKMMNYLQEKKAGDLKAQPDLAMGGALLRKQQNCYAERELEEVFKYSLMFTETEILIWEFLRTINPFFY